MQSAAGQSFEEAAKQFEANQPAAAARLQDAQTVIPNAAVTKNPLDAIAQTGNARRLFSHLDVPDAASMSRVSKAWNTQVKQSVLPDLRGRMTISDGEGGKTDFWTKVPDLESSRKQRRYFHPMSASGARESFPHISETQRRNKEPTHLTDISGKQWSRDDLNGRAPSGTYPTKTHLNLEPNPSAGPNAAKVSKEANHAILTDPRNQKQPTKQNKVFVKEGDVHVDYTQLQKFKQGRASAGSQEVLSPKQEKQTFAEVKDRWTGKDVIAIDKPKSD